MGAITTETIHIPSTGVTLSAFLAKPSDRGAKPGPAVVVVQEWWGLNEHIRDIARRFAEAGYVAIAPDLYSRQGNRVTTDGQEAAKLMESLSSQAALYDLNATVGYLKEQAFVDPHRLGMVGFCMGGTFALTMATHNSDLRAAVPFYGKVPLPESIDRLVCPVLYHYGGKDSWVTRKEVDLLKDRLQRLNKPGAVHIYPEADHAFFNDTRPEVHRPQDAALAWNRTMEFLEEHLR